MKKELIIAALLCVLLGVVSVSASAAKAGGISLIPFAGGVPVLRSDGTVVMVPSDGAAVSSDGAADAAGSDGSIVLSMLTIDASAIPPTVDSDGTARFMNAAKIRMTLSGAEPDASYLLTVQTEEDVPRENNLSYIAQKKAGTDGTAEFTIYPASADLEQEYYIYLSSNAVGEDALKDRTLVVRFRYVEAEAMDYSPGDLNGDGNITATDAVPILKQAAGLDTGLTSEQLKAADVNGDNSITASDAVPVLKVAAKLFETIEEAIAG